MPLEPFQRRIAKAMAGPEREHVILLPRGQGKTSLLALVAVHHLLTVPGPRVYVAAASREQARILFEYARDLAPLPVRRSPHVPPPRAPRRRRVPPRPRERRPKGPRAHAVTGDQRRGGTRTPTTSSTSPSGPRCSSGRARAHGEHLDRRPGRRQSARAPTARALAQPRVKRTGAFTDARGPGLRMLEWAVPEDGDADDAREVKQANPASWITVAGLREQRQAVPDLAYRRYHCNQWTAREGHWLPPGAWQACAGEPRFTDGEPIWIGVDVGGERSSVRGRLGQRGAARRLRDLPRRQRDPRSRRPCPCARPPVRRPRVVFDPWRVGQAAQELEREGIDRRCVPTTRPAHDPGERAPARRDRRAAHHPPPRRPARPARRGRDRPPQPPRLADRQAQPADQHRRRRSPSAWPSNARGFRPEPAEFLGWLSRPRAPDLRLSDRDDVRRFFLE